MGTRCRIALENSDKTIRSIYCHWDGYPEGVGRVLKAHYSDPTKLNKLLDLGDISSLGEHYDEELAKLQWKFWELPKEKQEELKGKLNSLTIPYKDRGEEDVEARVDNNYSEFMEKLGKCGEDYTYILRPDYSGVYVWEVCETPYFKEF